MFQHVSVAIDSKMHPYFKISETLKCEDRAC